ncbi:DNA-binding protein SATB1, partial [Caerostris darwini]
MDFHSVMETFAEAWVAANTHTPLTEAAEQGLINGPANQNSTHHGPTNQNSSHHGPTNQNSSHHGPTNQN